MDFGNFDKYIGDVLYKSRVTQRLTQGNVADYISKKRKEDGYKKGISRQAYSLYENGERSIPMDMLKSACSYLGLNYVEVFNEAVESMKIHD